MCIEKLKITGLSFAKFSISILNSNVIARSCFVIKTSYEKFLCTQKKD